MTTRDVKILCSPEQLDVIADHHIYGSELGVLPDERVWMIHQVRKQFGPARIVSAQLLLDEGVWLCTIQQDLSYD